MTQAFRRQSAMTLIEMLVVLAIIGVLASLLLPAVFSAREQGRRAACTNNLGQIGKSLMIYCNNNGNYLPSYPGYGLTSYTFEDPPGSGQSVVNFDGHQGASRHMVMGYSREVVGASDLTPGTLNFMPVGLGLLMMKDDLTDPRITICPSMRGAIDTQYGASNYRFRADIWKALGGKDGPNKLLRGDGRGLRVVNAMAATKVTAILASYSYRNTPFFNSAGPTSQTLAYTKPNVTAEFMTPAFKTRKQLKGRAIAADTFDFADAFPTDQGLGSRHHGDGYSVLYGEGGVKWFADEEDNIADYEDWKDTTNYGSNNLTISSTSSHEVWHQFDVAMDIDK